MSNNPTIFWDKGSAYDLFVSLYVLHRPDEYGLRPSWAAGVRSRLPIHLRDALEHSQQVLFVPMAWIHTLPEPKNAASALSVLRSLHPADRLPALTFANKVDQHSLDFKDFLMTLDGKQRMTARVEAQIRDFHRRSQIFTKDYFRRTFDAWSEREKFGEDLLNALEAFVASFFEEDEYRIIPAQEKALQNAQELIQKKNLLGALEELSEGVRMNWVSDLNSLVLAPSFWGAPFIFSDNLDEDSAIILFGARPEGSDLVPGELVPDELLNALKALSDPTRLRILHYLRESPRTPSELAGVLRLRPPTVIHHLQSLRLAGLISVTVAPNTERRYSMRKDGVDMTIQNLRSFVNQE